MRKLRDPDLQAAGLQDGPLPALSGDSQTELTRHVIEATGAEAALVAEEVARVLALGALVADQTVEGTRYRWAE